MTLDRQPCIPHYPSPDNTPPSPAQLQSVLKKLDLSERFHGRRLTLKKGATLFKQGDRFESMYVIHSGSLKTVLVSRDGEEQLTAFYFPNDIVGFFSMGQALYSTTAIALETSSISEIKFSEFDKLAIQDMALRNDLINLLSKRMRNAQSMQLLICKKNAEQRIASFLIGLSVSFRSKGFSADKFRLSMSRAEIANYLGLATETVSRIFTRLQSRNIIMIEGREIRLIEPLALADIAGETFGS